MLPRDDLAEGPVDVAVEVLQRLIEMSQNLRFASAVAEVAMLLRDSEWKGTSSWDTALTLLRDSGVTGDVYKEEFLYLVTLLARAAGD